MGGGFRGWRIVAVAFLCQAVALGFTLGVFGVFMEPIQAAFGATRAQVSLGLALSTLVTNAASPLVGRALDRGSIRNLLLLGSLLIGASLALLSVAGRLWQMALLFGGVAAVGVAILGPLAAAKLAANWFVARRGQALGIANTGSQLGVFASAPLAAAGIETLGWRPTLLAGGILALGLLLVPVWREIANRPEDVGQEPDGLAPDRVAPSDERPAETWGVRRLLGRADFWGMAVCIGILISAAIALAAHLVPYGTGLGFERARAAALLSTYAVSAIPGSIAAGWLADRFDLRALLWGSLALHAASWALLLTDLSYAALLATAILLGLCAGGTSPIYAAVVARYFGAAMLGSVMGIAAVVMLPLSFASVPLAGAVHDATGSYAAAIQGMIGAFAVAALSLLLLGRRPR